MTAAAVLLVLAGWLRPAAAQTPAPLVIFPPGTQSEPITDFTEPEGVAVDSSGNLYVTDSNIYQPPSYLYKETLSGGTYTQSVIKTGFQNAWAVAVDSGGNIFVTDFGQGLGGTNGAVYKETLSTGSYIQTEIGSGFISPDGIAVDSSGNVYVADFGCPECTPAVNGGFYKLTKSGSTYTQTQIGSVNYAAGVAMDSSGNLYVVSYGTYNSSANQYGGNGTLYKETLSGGSYTQGVIASNLVTPGGVTVDPSGNICVADDNNLNGGGIVYKETLSGGSYTQSALISDLYAPEDLAFDGAGNLYSAVITATSGGFPSAGAEYKVDYADPPTLSFGSVNVGSTSSTQTVTVENIGSATLEFEVPNSGNNPSIAPGFTLASGSTGECPLVTSVSSTVGGRLDSGASCTLPVAFAPQATGSYSGSTLVLTDHNANASPDTTQTISLSGTGTGTDKASYFMVTGSSPAAAGTATSITVKVYDSLGNLFTGYTGTVHFTSSDGSAVLPANSTLSSGVGTFDVTLKTAGIQTVTVTDTTTSSVMGSGAVHHLAVSAPSSATAGTSFSITVYAYDAFGNFTNSYGGTVHFTSTDGAASLPANSALSSGHGNFTATLNTAGSQTITATDTNNSLITGTSNSIAVDKAPAITSASSIAFIVGTAGSFTITASGYPAPTFSESGALPSGATLSSSGALSGTPVVGTGGSYSITITASNGVGTNATQNFTLTIDQSPAITSASSIAFTIGTAGSFTVTGVGYPAPTFVEAGALPSGVTFNSNGTLSGAPGAGTAGSYPLTITASNSVIPNAAQSFTLTINPPPYLVVTSTADDSGTASNCTAQASTTTGTNSSCSLRDALPEAASLGAGNIYFDTTKFASAATITLGSAGTLTIPSNTTIQGLTTGSGATLTNLVTISGGGTIQVFTVNSGVTRAAIANLNIVAGVTGINNNGALAVTNSTFSGNSATNSGGGGIFNSGTLTVTGSTFSGNSVSGPSSSGGGIFNDSLVNPSSSLTVANSVLAGDAGGECTGSGCPANGANGSVVGVSNISLAPLGNYGGPTQTMIPLPGSPAICAGLAASIANGTTTDQRGYANKSTTYAGYSSGSPCVDSGAVQSHYALSFSAEPQPISPATAIYQYTNFQAGVTLDDSGSAFTASAVGIPLSLTGTGTLANNAASTSGGVASYSTLQVSAGGTGDQLTATLALNPAISSTSPAITAASSNFDVTATSVPTITSANAAAFTVGTAGTFTVTTSSSPTANLSESGALPSGVMFIDNGNGTATFSGTPAAGTSGAYSLSVTANNGISPNATQSFTLTVDQAAAITSASSTTFTTGTSGSFTVTTTGYPKAALSESGSLPSGITFTNNGNGTATLIGTPAAGTGGVYTLSITAGNGVGSNATQSFTLTVVQATLTLTANNATKVYGTANPTFTGTVTGQQSSDSFTESFSTTAALSSPVNTYAMVPSVTGAHLDDYTQVVNNGTLSVTKAGTTTALAVSSASITPGQNGTLTAQVLSSTTGTPSGTVSFYDGTTLLSTVTTNSGAASYSATGLAPGLTHTLTAVYSGDANFTQSSTASNATVTVAPLDFTMTLSGPSNLTVVPGQSISYQVQVTPDYGSYAGTVNFAISGLPPGLRSPSRPQVSPPTAARRLSL
ncbi:MAG: putative Ig domain-containing protein [Silvibacterium sp.]